MNIPSPPTDSLYKFLSIIGSIIVLASLYFPIRFVDIQSDKILKLNIEVSKAKVEAEEIKKLANEYTTLIADKKMDSLEIKEKLNKQLVESRIKSEEHKIMLEEIKRLGITQIFVFFECVVIFILGIGMAYYGFHQWYYKIQIYQDKILQYQAKSINGNPE